MMRGGAVLAAALAVAAMPAAAQQGRGAVASGRVQCEGCDSATTAVAQRQRIDAEIAMLTTELARNRMLYENLRLRLAPDSPEPPRSGQERAELQARLAAQAGQMEQLTRRLSVLCGQQEPVRGYLGVEVVSPITTDVGPAGRSVTHVSYPIVQLVHPGSPAERAGLAVNDTIISINRVDPRGNSLAAFVREPGRDLSLVIGREGARRNVVLTVGERPPTFAGSCMQFRDVRFSDERGQNIAIYRSPGSATGPTPGMGIPGASGSGRSTQVQSTMRTRISSGAPGQQPVNITMRDSAVGTSSFIVLGSVGPLFLTRGGSSALVAGAEVSLVSGNLKAMFAVEHGTLVLNVAAGTPAQRSGLLDGDVIVRVNNEAVTSIAVLQRAIHEAQDKRSVALQVVRAKQPRNITLRW